MYSHCTGVAVNLRRGRVIDCRERTRSATPGVVQVRRVARSRSCADPPSAKKRFQAQGSSGDSYLSYLLLAVYASDSVILPLYPASGKVTRVPRWLLVSHQPHYSPIVLA